MLDTIRRLLAVAMLVVAVIGLIPLLPAVFGFQWAAVSTGLGGTIYPQATTGSVRFITCSQLENPITLRKDQTYPGSYIRCQNAWGYPVAVTVTVQNPNNTGLQFTSTNGQATGSLASGATGCLTGGIRATSNTGGQTPVTVVYRAQVNEPSLYATFEFTGQVKVQGNTPPADPVPCS